MKLGYFLEKKLKSNLISVTFPDDVKVNFSSLYGLEKEKEVLQDIIDYFRKGNVSTLVAPHGSYYICGKLGTGKASLVFAVAKEANVPIISFDCSIFGSAESTEIEDIFNLIFNTARKLRKFHGGCLIAFKNAEEIELMDNDNFFYTNLLKNIFDLESIFMFMLSSKQYLNTPAAICENDLFTTVLAIELPNLAIREKIFEDYIQKYNIKLASDVSINRLAKDTIGETPLSIAYIIKEAQLYSLRQKHLEVTQSDFSETIMKLSAGEKHFKMTEKERRLTAYHEAGHVIAGYFSNPEYILKRVEISPRSQGSLGLTATDVDENKYSFFKKDFENLLIEYLGGLCAEEVKFGSHTSGVISDLSIATTLAYNMIAAYGMGESISPMVIRGGITDSPFSKAIVEAEIIDLLQEYYKKTTQIVKDNLPYLEALANSLIEKEVIFGNEIEEIFKNVPAEISE